MQLEKRASFTLNLKIDDGGFHRLTAAFSYSNQERRGVVNLTIPKTNSAEKSRIKRKHKGHFFKELGEEWGHAVAVY